MRMAVEGVPKRRAGRRKGFACYTQGGKRGMQATVECREAEGVRRQCSGQGKGYASSSRGVCKQRAGRWRGPIGNSGGCPQAEREGVCIAAKEVCRWQRRGYVGGGRGGTRYGRGAMQVTWRVAEGVRRQRAG